MPPSSSLLPFAPSCRHAAFLRRVKRFSVEVEANGQRLWAHTNNSGSMAGLLAPGNETLLSAAQTPGRKLPYTLELIKADGVWVGVNTSTPNKLLSAAFASGRLPWAGGYTTLKREASCAPPHADVRLDALLSGPGLPPLWIEAKNVTLRLGALAAFPDAATARGRKHLQTLMDLKAQGCRCACFYLIQRADVSAFAPARSIDPAYAALFYQALGQGVEIYPYRAEISEQGIDLGPLLPLVRPTG